MSAYGNVSDCPQWFKVESKNGFTYEYGNTVDSRFMDQSNTIIISWLLNKSYDQYGNYIEYIYEMNGREIRLKEIKYTGNANVGLSPYNLTFR